MQKITIKDIARLAGVSVATVSYVINGIHEDRYTQETKNKVLQIVNLYNFRPSRLAQSLALSKSHNIIILMEKHQTVLQKAESYDFLRLLGKTFERCGFNLIMRTYLEETKVDTADAIICVGMEEEKFRSLAKENFVPFLSVDGKICDELFFQVYQDFSSVVKSGEREFGKGNFSLVLLDMYNETLKKEIRELTSDVVFVSGSNCKEMPEGNIVTVNSSLKEVAEMFGRKVYFAPSNNQNKIDALIECFNMATERVQGMVHTMLVK